MSLRIDSPQSFQVHVPGLGLVEFAVAADDFEASMIRGTTIMIALKNGTAVARTRILMRILRSPLRLRVEVLKDT